MLGRRPLLVAAAVVFLVLMTPGGAGADEAPPPPSEVLLSTPAVETLAKAPTPWMRKQLGRLDGSLKPAKRSRARIVARLKLTLPHGSGLFWFVTYRSRAGHICGITYESEPGFSAAATGGLSCTGACTDVCAGMELRDQDSGWVAWSATVPSVADAARLTLDDGERFRFALVGPRVGSALTRRVLLVQLPVDRSVTLAEALQGDTTIASQAYGPESLDGGIITRTG